MMFRNCQPLFYAAIVGYLLLPIGAAAQTVPAARRAAGKADATAGFTRATENLVRHLAEERNHLANAVRNLVSGTDNPKTQENPGLAVPEDGKG